MTVEVGMGMSGLELTPPLKNFRAPPPARCRQGPVPLRLSVENSSSLSAFPVNPGIRVCLCPPLPCG